MEILVRWIPILILLIVNILSISGVYWHTQIRIAVLKEKVQHLEKQRIDYTTLHDDVIEIKTKLNYLVPKKNYQNE